MGIKEKVILHIDDDEDFIAIVNKICGSQGMKYLGAGSIAEAMTIMQDRIPHMILLDLMLEGETGLDFFKAIDNKPVLQNIPIIVCSGQDAPKIVAHMMKKGVRDYIVKPIKQTELIQKFRRLFFDEEEFGNNKFEWYPEPGSHLAEVEIECELMKINETAIGFQSPAKFMQEEEFVLNSEHMRKDKIQIERLRSLGKSRATSDAGDFLTIANLVGVPEKIAAEIRKMKNIWGSKK
jgi:twitching motility two-component system response regulator PilH